MNGTRMSPTRLMPATPSATAAATPATLAPTSTGSGMLVPSG